MAPKKQSLAPKEQVAIFAEIMKRHLDALYVEATPHAKDESAVGRLLGMVAHRALSSGFYAVRDGYGLPSATDWLSTVLQGFSIEAARRGLKIKASVVVTTTTGA
jgi:hypothetical protein